MDNEVDNLSELSGKIAKNGIGALCTVPDLFFTTLPFAGSLA